MMAEPGRTRQSAAATAHIRDGNRQIADGTALIEQSGDMIKEGRTQIEAGKRALQQALEQSMTIGIHDAISREQP